MKNYSQYFIAFILGLFLVVGCTDKDETFMVTDGSETELGGADFSTYVAFGNSLTAGYADNALYDGNGIGQSVAYPNLIAESMGSLTGDYTYTYPSTNSTIGINANGEARLILNALVDGNPDIKPIEAQGDLSILESVAADGPYNNMGVPGATSVTAVYPGYGTLNPFFGRMTSDPENATMLGDAVAQDPTFFSVFIGNNDVLGYATAGGADPNAPITDMADFSAAYDAIIDAFTTNGAKGAVANIPDVTDTPFFTTIPYNALVLEEEQAAQLNGGIDQMLDQLGLDRDAVASLGIALPEFNAGPNPLFAVDDDPTNVTGIRPLEEGELVTLSAQGDLAALQDNLANAEVIFQQIGAALATLDFAAIKAAAQQLALPDKDFLSKEQLQNVEDATTAFNDKIKSVAEEKELAFVDTNAYLSRIQEEGIYVNGNEIRTDFVSGGAFSLDGIHLTPVANALLANEFIKAINATYGSTLPEVNASKYGRVQFPD